MTDQNAVDPDATPPYGIVGSTDSNGSVRAGRLWFVVIGVAIALMLIALMISRS
jgi:uncharacterized membrane protein YgaE (UPF0421/DUF939 family)